ncbi:Unknown protein sequence [Pseudomonas amygdali pv. lachrymans]|nr:Unknown protein sequence [Pseudomonas amygdali pv. lachrymans]
MRRRNVRQPTVRLLKVGATHTLAVHRYTLQPRTRQCERVTCRAIARIFHCNALAWRHQQLCTKADCVLRATGDHNLLSSTAQPSRGAKIRRNQLSQPPLSRRSAIAQLIEIWLAPKRRIQLAPQGEREKVKRGNPDPKGLGPVIRGLIEVVLFNPLQRGVVDNLIRQILRVFNRKCGQSCA